jgi:hypothetical protein
MAVSKFSLTLETEPQANFHDFERIVLEEYESECKKYTSHGLFHLVATDHQWENATGNTTIEVDGTKTIVNRPTFNLPVDPAANAGTATVSLYSRHADRYQNVVEITENLKKCLLASLGADNVSHISDPIHGIRNITAFQIMEEMRKLHGTASAEVILAYKQKLEIAMTADQSFSSIACVHRNTHSQLLRADQPLSMFDKVTLLVRAVSNRIDIIEAVKSYKIRVRSNIRRHDGAHNTASTEHDRSGRRICRCSR